MRTSLWDVILFAWQLIRMREQRKHLRIGQMIGNTGDAFYYYENDKMRKVLEQTRVAP
jgi:hypothetical protein